MLADFSELELAEFCGACTCNVLPALLLNVRLMPSTCRLNAEKLTVVPPVCGLPDCSVSLTALKRTTNS